MATARARGPLLCVVGARPNYMKMGPLIRAFGSVEGLPPALLVHTGQHYDVAMNEKLFADLKLRAPDRNLEVGSGSHAVQTAEIMRRFEPLLDEYVPSCVIVVGDVNSTVACSLVAVKRGVPLVHVEAGLRSFDRSMPEEINRLLTDQMADRLYTSERSAADNLAREGVAAERIFFAGNVMIDSVVAHRARAVAPATTFARADIAELGRGDRGYGVVTLHRPSNVDSADAFAESLALLRGVSKKLPLVWPMHPRARDNVKRFGLGEQLADSGIVVLPPQGYLEMLGLMAGARVVLTDSGGIQEETTALSVPCLTMRENTERPITIEQGTNTLVGRDSALAMRCVETIMNSGGKAGRQPEFWDGRAADRIAQDLLRWLNTEQLNCSEARA